MFCPSFVLPPQQSHTCRRMLRRGLRMPGEFEAHARCWMAWPHRADVWRHNARPAREAFAAVAHAILRGGEDVTVCAPSAHMESARAMLDPRVRVVAMESNDAWMRDIGPTFVLGDGDGTLAGIDWKFNAWGGLYADFEKDAEVAAKILELEENTQRIAAPLVLEGGSIHADGEGTLLTTKECLLNPNRNPHLSQDEIEAHLKEYLGVSQVVWLNRGVFKDETSGHVDNLCCFVRPSVVALAWTDNPDDENYDICRENEAILNASTDAKGRKFTVERLHLPPPLFYTKEESEGVDAVESSQPRREGERLAGSYVNFYIANTAIVMPSLHPDTDEKARAKLQELFPGREIIPVPSREILLGGGNIHCITQQQPRTILKE